MGSCTRLIAIALLVGLVAGGCPGLPASSEWQQTGVSASSDSSAGGDSGESSQTTATSPLPEGAATDSLTEEFPGCYELAEAAKWCDEVQRLVNEERLAEGVGALERNATLEAQAEQYACEMVYYGFFDHNNPATGSTLRDRADEFGYDYQVIGENLAGGQPSPAEVVAAWMASPGHRENILDARFVEVGVAVRAGGHYGVYWVLEFGLPR